MRIRDIGHLEGNEQINVSFSFSLPSPYLYHFRTLNQTEAPVSLTHSHGDSRDCPGIQCQTEEPSLWIGSRLWYNCLPLLVHYRLRVCVVGATSGIAESTMKQFCRHTVKPRLYFIGR